MLSANHSNPASRASTDRVFSVREAAALLGVSHQTVRNRIRDQAIEATANPVTGHLAISSSELERHGVDLAAQPGSAATLASAAGELVTTAMTRIEDVLCDAVAEADEHGLGLTTERIAAVVNECEVRLLRAQEQQLGSIADALVAAAPFWRRRAVRRALR